MDEKIFNLITQMYSDLKESQEKIYSEMQEMKTGTKQDIVRLEHKMDENHKALYDGYKQNSEGITELKNELINLSKKVERQEIKLQIVK